MDAEDLKKIFADEAFVRGLFSLQTSAQFQSALKAKGLSLSETNILAIRDLITELNNGTMSVEQLENGELPEALLDQVAGGTVPLGEIMVAVSIVCTVAKHGKF